MKCGELHLGSTCQSWAVPEVLRSRISHSSLVFIRRCDCRSKRQAAQDNGWNAPCNTSCDGFKCDHRQHATERTLAENSERSSG